MEAGGSLTSHAGPRKKELRARPACANCGAELPALARSILRNVIEPPGFASVPMY